MLEEVRQYATAGFCVLPVKPGEKRPFLTAWEKYIEERPTIEQIESWYTNLTNPGVGFVTGAISGVVVLDIDHRSGDIQKTYSETLQKYPTQLVVRTGSGGYHLYYKHPGGKIGNRVNILPGIDLRADGGFIVAPPTLHPNGQPYEWILGGPLGDFPLTLLQQEATKGPSEEKWLSESLKGVSSGGRNDTAARLAGYFFKKGIPIDVVYSMLTEWNKKNIPPLDEQELQTTVKSVSRKAPNDWREPTDVIMIDDTGKTVMAPKPPSFDLVKFNRYLHDYGDDGMQWAVEDWLPEKSIVFLVSPPESYKTWILIDLAVSLAANLPFLGEFTINKPGPVIIVQQEDSHSGMAERISVVAQSRLGLSATIGKTINSESCIPILPELPIYVHPSRNLRFDNKKVMDELEQSIKKIRPSCVIIDPLYSATSTDNYMADASEDMFRLKKFRDEYDCSFVIAHHSKKHTEPNSTAREDLWGSQFLNAFLETGWQIRKSQQLADNEIVVRRHSKTMGNQTLISVSFDISTKFPSRYQVTTKPYDSAGVGRPAQNQLYEMIMNEPMSVSDMALKMGKHKSTVCRQLKQLETTNMVQKIPDGRYRAIKPGEE